MRCAAAQEPCQRHHRHDAEQPNGHISEAPALGRKGQLHGERPDRAGKVVAAGGGRHGHAAPLLEPVGNVGDQRAEGCGGTEADKALQDGEGPDRGHHGRADITDRQCHGRDHERHQNARAVQNAADEDIAKGKADHRHRVRQRGIGARNSELGLDCGQDHHDRPHADTADRGNEHADGKTCPGIAAVYTASIHETVLHVAPPRPVAMVAGA